MKTIQISRFKAGCIAILKEVQRTEEPVAVTIRGKRIATVHPAHPTPEKKQLGSLRGKMAILCDLVAETSQDDWEMLRK